MNILMVAEPYIPVPPPKYGGTELIIYNLIKGLTEDGHDVTLIAPGDSKVPCELVPVTEKAIFFPRDYSDVPAHRKKAIALTEATRRMVEDLAPGFDIIHSHGIDLKGIRSKPAVTTIHGPITIDLIDYFSHRREMFFTPISKNQTEVIPDLKYTKVVYNGEDPEMFPIVEEPSDYLCFIGRFDREKNPHLAINLAVKLGTRIKIAGKIDAQGDRYFAEEIAPYLNNPLVEYMGELGFDDKVELISNAACNLHPTGFREPFGLTVMEAAYCGTPTLAIARGSMPELIDEGFTGMLVEDFAEGYNAVEECLEMDRAYIASRTRRLFNYKNMTRGYIRAYKQVIRKFEEEQAS